MEKNEKQRITYIPQGGVCSKMMIVDIADGKIENAQVIGGWQGMCALLKGMSVEEAIRRIEGIDCHGRGTSCPDQMAQALKQAR